MRLKGSLLIICLALATLNICAQVEETVKPDRTGQEEKKSFGQRLVFGGDIGLSFGSITYINLSPVIGYRITDRLTAGLGPIYIYEKYKNLNFETSTYGGKAVASFALLKGSPESGNFLGLGDIVLHAENEITNVEPLYYNAFSSYYYLGDRIWIDNLLLGAGLIQTISGRFSISMFIMWDVTQNDYSPYSNPIFKFGFGF